MASKMVTDRQAVGRDVLAALEAHGGEVADELRREVGDAAGGVEELQATLRRRLEERLEALVAADEEHLAATGDLAVARRRRDEAARELARLLVAVRKLAEGIYGAGARELLRIEGRVAQRPVPMLRQARRVMARLADPEMPRPERSFAGATADEGEWAELLAPAIDALAAALESTNMARRRAESTLLAKSDALAAYDLAHGRLARYGEALFELAGLPEYASRLRPRARRRGRATARRPPIAVRQPFLHPVDQPAGEEQVDLARREVVAEADLPVLALVTGDELATRRLPPSTPPNRSPRLIRGGGRALAQKYDGDARFTLGVAEIDKAASEGSSKGFDAIILYPHLICGQGSELRYRSHRMDAGIAGSWRRGFSAEVTITLLEQRSGCIPRPAARPFRSASGQRPTDSHSVAWRANRLHRQGGG